MLSLAQSNQWQNEAKKSLEYARRLRSKTRSSAWKSSSEQLKTAGSRLESPSALTSDKERNVLSISIVMVNYNGLQLLKKSLPAIDTQDHPHFEVIIVDNASTDGSTQYITQSFPVFRCIRSRVNLHYTKAMNVGIRESHGNLLLLMNNDVNLDRSFLSNMIRAARAEPDAGIFGPKVFYHGTRFVQYAAGKLYTRKLRVPSCSHEKMEQVDWILGAVWMIRRSVFKRIGLLDEENYTAYFEESDFQRTAKERGIRMIYVPFASASHVDSATLTAGSEIHAYHWTKGFMSFALIHLPLMESMIRVVIVLSATLLDIAYGRPLAARGRMFGLRMSVKMLPVAIRRRIQLRYLPNSANATLLG